MKNILKFLFILAFSFAACKTEKKEENAKKVEKEVVTYASFGDKISDDNAMSSQEMLAKFKNLQVGDTINVKFASKINSVCKKKGCWMKLELGENKESMVRFKDYGFFMPLNSDNSEVIVNGKAFIKETSVKELQHYAKDAGKTEEEIAKITKAKREFAFLANGVLLETQSNESK